ncbi:phytanoyl-CoA dioxygenase family protein [Phycisphaerales bacterium AB-hyl4]|uniref:Phytanoyl-CoA dioxygenase family protein n=1 Tax=Natronomicrosphaera hydrolytica TaxID=3242702 RepID=A0ABV4U5I4_9BACT
MPQDCQELVETYQAEGVIRVRKLFDADRMAGIRQALDRYSKQIAPTLPASDVTFEADGQSVRNLWRMEQHDAFFSDLADDAQLLELVRELVQGEPVLMAVETFNKPAKTGSGVPAHQDNAYFCRTPPDVLTVWVAVDPVTLANGPVSYVRGSHKLGMLPHKPSGVAGNSMGLDAPYDDSDPFVGTLEPGDALMHHCQSIHYSAPNTTDQSRCGLLMVFRAEHAKVDSQLKGQYALGGPAT